MFWQFVAWFHVILEVVSISGPSNTPFFKRVPTRKLSTAGGIRSGDTCWFPETYQHKECSVCHDFRVGVHQRGMPVVEKVEVARQ